ncbi:GroES-like protein [Pleomassaria siparia CBS 279.74]|uniref:GroES-like protein n=1 Tax=Pleomassaria siparia CBS 279.74 TaxID=1314801 RepID=A0A6G1JXW2_9PLEO|nr:GroES-like protein [Pleomassaria siparia CBS 279.74]
MGILHTLKSCFTAKPKLREIDSTRPASAGVTAVFHTPPILTEKPITQLATPTITGTTTPFTQQALIVATKGTYLLDESFPVPEIQDGEEVLIRNHAVGLNPIDWKSVDWNFCIPTFPWVTGREMSGVVEQVGENVTEFKKGDRVWTSTDYYRDIRSGCFQEYVIAPKHTVKPIPSKLSFESAACLGVCGLTAAMTLWKWLGIPMFDTAQSSQSSGNLLLVWGGSSITGQFLIQIATYSGLEVIAVTSERTAELVSRLGAKHVITRDDKSNDDIVAEARAIGGDAIVKAVDIVGPETAVYCMKALSSKSPVQLAPLSFLPKDVVTPPNVSIENVEMKWFVLNKISESYATALNSLVERGCVKIPELDVIAGGLAAIPEGLNMQKRGNLGGKKLVVSLRG